MKIAVNTRFLLPGKLEGIGWFSYEILRHLTKNPENDFFFIFDRPFDHRFIFSENITPVQAGPPARHPFLFYLWFEWVIPKVLKRVKADVFLSTDGFLSLRARTKTVLFWHDLSYLYFPGHVGLLQRWYYRFFVPRFLRRADHIVTFSQHSAADIQRHFQVPAFRITVSAGAPRPSFQPASSDQILETRQRISGGQPYFLYAGAIHPRKNIDSLIRAFDLFKQSSGLPFKLVLAGRMAWKVKPVQAALKQSPFRQDIILPGHLDHGMEAITAASHAMVYPSFYEGFGLPIIESIQCNVPVITSNCASMPEVAGKAGLLVDPYDVQSIATAMNTLATEEAFYHSLVSECAGQAAKFNWVKTAEAVGQAVRKISAAPGL